MYVFAVNKYFFEMITKIRLSVLKLTGFDDSTFSQQYKKDLATSTFNIFTTVLNSLPNEIEPCLLHYN
jgi:hypothetical protein